MLMIDTAGAEASGAGDAGEAEQGNQDAPRIAESDTAHATGSDFIAVELAPSVGDAGEAGREAEAALITLAERGAAVVEVAARIAEELPDAQEAERVQAMPTAADADDTAQAGPAVEVSAEGAAEVDEAAQGISQEASQYGNESSEACVAAPHAEASEGYQEEVCTVTEVIEAIVEVPTEPSAGGTPDATAGAVEDEAAQREGAGAKVVAVEAEIDAEAAAAEGVVAVLSAAEADSSDGGADKHEQCEVGERDNSAKQVGGEESAGAEGKLPAPLWEQYYGAGSGPYLWQGAAQHWPGACYIGWEFRGHQNRKACYRQAACIESCQSTAFWCAF